MNRIIMYIFSKTSFGKFLDGKKTVIGAVLIILSQALQALEQIAPLFPEAVWLKDTAAGLSEGLKALEKALETVGIGFLTFGVMHKNAKGKEQK